MDKKQPANPAEKKPSGRRKTLKQLAVGGAVAGSAEWAKPVIETVILPAHAQTSELLESDLLGCDSAGIILIDDFIIYRAGDGIGIWTNNPAETVQPGFVAINSTPTLIGTLPTDTIFWEVQSAFGPFDDVANGGAGTPLTNGNIFVTQETGVGTVTPNPDSAFGFGPLALSWRATITRPGCPVPFIRTITYGPFNFQNEMPAGSGSQSTQIDMTFSVEDENGIFTSTSITITP